MYRSDLKYGLSTQTGSHVALMIIGAIIFVVAFCGCCGAIRENSFLIGAVSHRTISLTMNAFILFSLIFYCSFQFSISLVLLIVIEISIGIFIYSNENKAKEYIIDGIKIEFEEYNNRTNLIAFNALQEDVNTSEKSFKKHSELISFFVLLSVWMLRYQWTRRLWTNLEEFIIACDMLSTHCKCLRQQ